MNLFWLVTLGAATGTGGLLLALSIAWLLWRRIFEGLVQRVLQTLGAIEAQKRAQQNAGQTVTHPGPGAPFAVGR